MSDLSQWSVRNRALRSEVEGSLGRSLRPINRRTGARAARYRITGGSCSFSLCPSSCSPPLLLLLLPHRLASPFLSRDTACRRPPARSLSLSPPSLSPSRSLSLPNRFPVRGSVRSGELSPASLPSILSFPSPPFARILVGRATTKFRRKVGKRRGPAWSRRGNQRGSRWSAVD